MMRYFFCLTLCVSLAMGNMIFAQNAGKDSVAQKLFSGEKQLQPWADEMEKGVGFFFGAHTAKQDGTVEAF